VKSQLEKEETTSQLNVGCGATGRQMLYLVHELGDCMPYLTQNVRFGGTDQISERGQNISVGECSEIEDDWRCRMEKRRRHELLARRYSACFPGVIGRTHLENPPITLEKPGGQTRVDADQSSCGKPKKLLFDASERPSK
jgi:hypothetical protein